MIKYEIYVDGEPTGETFNDLAEAREEVQFYVSGTIHTAKN